MIEFKAECGHTVRAKDEDAGGVVRCSYCGRAAPVPDSEKNDLSFLFKDVEKQSETAGSRRRRRGFFRQRQGKDGGFNPFPVIFRLCYAALLIIILVVVARKFVLPMFDDEQRVRRLASSNTDAAPAPVERERAVRDVTSPGLTGVDHSNGLYVASTPPGASVFCVEESKAPLSGRINALANCSRFRANGAPARLSDGTYIVEIAFAWNDPQLCDPSLSGYQEYFQFRRAIEKASQAKRTQLANQFFLPDEASDVFVDETVDQIYIVRQYRSVAIRQGQSPGVRALFLPRLGTAPEGRFSIEALLHGYIPQGKAYNFDEAHVKSELAYYGVAPADRPYVIQALARVGLIPYTTPDGQIRLFKIGIQDGVFSTRLLGAAGP